jgi:hypothetical protein
MKTNHQQNLPAAALVCGAASKTTITRAQDPLLSWNYGSAKQASMNFVKAAMRCIGIHSHSWMNRFYPLPF